jgi:hypothetical protein
MAPRWRAQERGPSGRAQEAPSAGRADERAQGPAEEGGAPGVGPEVDAVEARRRQEEGFDARAMTAMAAATRVAACRRRRSSRSITGAQIT